MSMGIIRAFTGAISGTFVDQWKDIITAGYFDEHTVISPGLLQQPDKGRGSYNNATVGVISNGSKIFVPENTAAFIFSQSGIEKVITIPGGYEYQHGQETIFNGDGIGKSIFGQIGNRIGYGGQTSEQKQIAFVNLREIRGIRFGTRGPLIYNDLFYGADLAITAFGSFSLKVLDAEKFIRFFVPPNVTHMTFNDQRVKDQLSAEFLQSFIDALNSISTKYRISQLPSQASELASGIAAASSGAGTWNERFGLEVVAVGIENIELTPESRELVQQYSSTAMQWKAHENVTQATSNIVAQQKIAQGIQDNGFGDGMPGMILGMNMAQALNPLSAASAEQAIQQQPTQQTSMTIAEQIEAVKNLKELHDAGILSQEEFDAKKKEIMGL
jgi:membrane protease subunit (stomatin/prohibitin family)